LSLSVRKIYTMVTKKIIKNVLNLGNFLQYLHTTIISNYNQPISFMRNNSTKILTSVKILALLCLSLASFAQGRQVTGKITGPDKSPMIGASILLKGTNVGTSTDVSGSYKINVPGDNSVLIISSVGMRTQEIKVGSQTTISVELADETNSLNEIVVSGTVMPVRKLESITPIESISYKQIERSTNVSIADAVKFVPGVFTHAGPGRTRNSIWMRGFPDNTGNGLVYTAINFEGLRTFASPEMVPDAAFRMDLGVERVEVVRGSAATLYGRGAAAGAINVIAKTGGVDHSGIARLTFSNNNMRQIDLNVNGPLNEAKTLRYNLSGFYLSDDGFRNNPFPDYGGQIRYNIDYLIPNNGGSLRLYGGFIDLNVQNQIDLPYNANDLSKPAFGWTTNDVIYPKGRFNGNRYAVNWNDGQTETIDFQQTAQRGNASTGWNFGASINLNLGNGWTFVNKGRYQDITTATIFDFPISQIYTSSQTRAYFLGGLPGKGGSNGADLINEARIQKQFRMGSATHNLTGGYYYSGVTVNAASVAVLYSANTTTKELTTVTPIAPSIFRNGTYKESVNSYFIGDEAKVGERLTVSAGYRYDQIFMDMTDSRQTFQRFSNRKVDHSGTNYSLGFNYLLNDHSAIYATYTNAYRAPDYSAYTSVQYAYRNTTDPEGTAIVFNPATAPATAVRVDQFGRPLYDRPYIDKNENIQSWDIGYRTSWKDFSFDGGLFMNTIYDRLVTTFVGALSVQVPGGDNRIIGAEASLTWTPSDAKGWFVRTSVTAQKTEYLKLEQGVVISSKNGIALPTPQRTVLNLAGNRVASIPSIMWNTNLGYENDRWGFNLNNVLTAGRPVDQANTANYPVVSLMDVNTFVKIPLEGKQSLKLRASCYNLLYDTSASSVVSAQTDDAMFQTYNNNFTNGFTNVRGVPFLPRRVMVSLDFTF
jgi:outer membrane receptor protein involved in Fe transport